MEIRRKEIQKIIPFIKQTSFYDCDWYSEGWGGLQGNIVHLWKLIKLFPFQMNSNDILNSKDVISYCPYWFPFKCIITFVDPLLLCNNWQYEIQEILANILFYRSKHLIEIISRFIHNMVCSIFSSSIRTKICIQECSTKTCSLRSPATWLSLNGIL